MDMRNRNDNLPHAADASRRRLLLGMAATTGAGALGVIGWLRSDSAAAASGSADISGEAQVKRVRIVLFDNSGRRLDERLLPKVVKTEAEWKRLLAPLAYKVTREEGTERAFSGHYQI